MLSGTGRRAGAHRLAAAAGAFRGAGGAAQRAMVCGFFGFGIALERAAALKCRIASPRRRWRPVARLRRWRCSPGWRASSGCWPRWRWWRCMPRCCAAPELHTAVEAAARSVWAGGTLWWLLARPFSVVVAVVGGIPGADHLRRAPRAGAFRAAVGEGAARLYRHGCRCRWVRSSCWPCPGTSIRSPAACGGCRCRCSPAGCCATTRLPAQGAPLRLGAAHRALAAPGLRG